MVFTTVVDQLTMRTHVLSWLQTEKTLPSMAHRAEYLQACDWSIADNLKLSLVVTYIRVATKILRRFFGMAS